jgi:TRAP transporter TAXI family solute receptor
MTETIRATRRSFTGGGIGAALMFSPAGLASQIPDARAQAQARIPDARAQAQARTSALVEKINANTLMVLTAGSGLTYGAMAADLATVLNDGDNFRILPVQGHSAFLNVRDVRYLRGVDMGFIQSNVLGHYRRKGLIGDLAEKIVYVLKICNNEIHIVARAGMKSVEELRGKKVNFNQVDSGAQVSAQDLFGYLGIEVQEVNLRQNDALEMLKNGEIAATIALAGKPAPALAKLKAKDGYRILAVPYDKRMGGDFLPVTFTHQDYPDLIAEGQTVDTVASGTVLIAYNWPKNTDRYRRIDKFVKAFFPRLAEFQKPPRHEKWKDTVLSAGLPGSKRFEGAEEWVRQQLEENLEVRREEFQQFLLTRNVSGRGGVLPENERNKLFEEFLKWSGRN